MTLQDCYAYTPVTMSLQKFPGLIDIHVHLRDPGATHKEDFISGSRAALSGGFTFVCDMPNNPTSPTVTLHRLEEKYHLAKKKALCDIGLYFGSAGANLDMFPEAYSKPYVYGLKIYCGHTTGELLLDDEKTMDAIFQAWQSDKSILLHAEGHMVELGIALASTYKRRIHICHIANRDDLEKIREAKAKGVSISTGVTPHHLFLSASVGGKLGGYGLVKPPLVDEDTQSALWDGIRDTTIDLVESDHAPHTREEKESSTPYFGVPGLETTLALMLLAVKQRKCTLSDVARLLYDNPKRIFSLPHQPETYIEFDPDTPFRIGEEGYQSKSQWSPFDGWEAYGKIERVVLYGKLLVENGVVL